MPQIWKMAPPGTLENAIQTSPVFAPKVLLAKESLAAYFAKLNMYLDSKPLDSTLDGGTPTPFPKSAPELPYMQISYVFLQNASRFAQEAATPQKAIDLGKTLLPDDKLSKLINPNDVKVKIDSDLTAYLKDTNGGVAPDPAAVTALSKQVANDLPKVKLAATAYMRDAAAIVFGLMWRTETHQKKYRAARAVDREDDANAQLVKMQEVRIFRNVFYL